jgi:hypothetical protein
MKRDPKLFSEFYVCLHGLAAWTVDFKKKIANKKGIYQKIRPGFKPKITSVEDHMGRTNWDDGVERFMLFYLGGLEMSEEHDGLEASLNLKDLENMDLLNEFFDIFVAMFKFMNRLTANALPDLRLSKICVRGTVQDRRRI